MRNQDRLPTPYLLGNSENNSLAVAGIPLGTALNTENGSAVIIKTNGGVLVALSCSDTVETANPPDPNE